MDDAVLVRRFERFRDLAGDVQRLRQWQRPGRDPTGERRPIDELEDEIPALVHDFDAVDRADVRMIERGEDLGLALEPRDAFGVACQGIGQRFDRDVPVEPRVARAVDFAHAAGAKRRSDFIGADVGACVVDSTRPIGLGDHDRDQLDGGDQGLAAAFGRYAIRFTQSQVAVSSQKCVKRRAW